MKTTEAESAAETALANADAAELYKLFHAAVKDRGEALTALDGIVRHYAGSRDMPRLIDPSPVECMERVALAAIALAREVALGKGVKVEK